MSRSAASSPCIKLCLMDAVTGLCDGCGRSLSEIGGWSRMSETERLAVMRQLPARLDARRHMEALMPGADG